MYDVYTTNQYERDLEKAKKRRLNIERLEKIITLLASSDKPLPAQYKDHKLSGEYAGYRECHIENDWLLIYKKEKNNLILVLTRTGRHSDLF
ncbi:MAG: type II toxin-antitoxin system YafQ family toxin [Bacteroidetes bacterium]|nr:type II toxin-antitoxin system YafQ family toxin [Bacteroidota bacterium]